MVLSMYTIIPLMEVVQTNENVYDENICVGQLNDTSAGAYAGILKRGFHYS